jgi:hypothetical protein
MVNMDHISHTLHGHFRIKGGHQIDPQTGVVNVQGDVILMQRVKHLPVQFGTVSGTFDCSENMLASLQGSPSHVGKTFSCYDNSLNSLEGGPTHVGGVFNCQQNNLFVNLVGAPQFIGSDCWFDYHDKLPLLRWLVVKGSVLSGTWPLSVIRIMNDTRFKGNGKAVAIACAVELTRAGFKGNARW